MMGRTYDGGEAVLGRFVTPSQLVLKLLFAPLLQSFRVSSWEEHQRAPGMYDQWREWWPKELRREKGSHEVDDFAGDREHSEIYCLREEAEAEEG